MTLPEIASLGFIAVGVLFFIAGTVGLLRFPDLFCRLHALTKADTLGLGLICVGVALLTAQAGDLFRIALIWVFVVIAGATGAHLIARHARRDGTGFGREE